MLQAFPANAESFTGSDDAAKRIISPGQLTDREREQLKLERSINDLKAEDYMVVEKAIYRFEHLGGRGIRILIDIVNDKGADERQRINAVYALGRIGPRAQQSIPALIKAAEDGSNDMQAVVASALGKMRVGTNEVIHALKDLLEDDSEWVTKKAMRSLQDIGGRNAMKTIADYQKIKSAGGKID